MKSMTERAPRLLVVDHNAVWSADRALYRELREVHGFDVAVVVPRRWQEQFGPGTWEHEKTELCVIPSSVLFNGKTHRVLYGALPRALRRFTPDLLLVNSEPEGFAALQAAVLCAMLQHPPQLVFQTWRNMAYGKGAEPYPVRWPWLSGCIEAIVLRRSVRGIEHSPGGTSFYEALGFRRITEIPPWVDQHVFTAVEKVITPAGSEVSGLRVGYVGRFVPEKGILLLMDAVAASGIPATIVLLGDGPQRPDLEVHARELGTAVQVEFLSPVPHPRVADILRGLDVLALPSTTRPGWSEQFGRVLIEAMACGVPVIGSSSGAIPSVIGDAGIVVPAGDVGELAAAIRRLQEQPEERARLSGAGLRRVASEFSVPVVARKYADLLRRICLA
jgi:glycosyltransferase involved in cell wall biosynthesis